MARSGYQDITIPLSGGRDGDVDPKLLSPPKLTAFKNARYYRRGEIRKRPPRTAVGQNIQGGGTLSYTGVQLFKRGKELLVYTNNNLYRWSPNNSTWALVSAMETGSFRGLALPHPNSYVGQLRASHSRFALSADGTELFVAHPQTGAGGTWTFSLLDTDSGQVVLHSQGAITGTPPLDVRVAEGLNYWGVFYLGTGNNLRLATIAKSDFTVTDRGNVITDRVSGNSAAFDVTYSSSSGIWIVAYEDSSNEIRLRALGETGSNIATASDAATPTGPIAVGLSLTSGDAHYSVVFQTASGIELWTANSGLSSFVGPTVIDSAYSSREAQNIVVEPIKSTGALRYFYDSEMSDWPTAATVKTGTADSSGNASGPTEISTGQIFSKPFLRNGTYCVVLQVSDDVGATGSGPFSSTFVVVDSSGNVLARLLPGEGVFNSGDQGGAYGPALVATNGNKAYLPIVKSVGVQTPAEGTDTYELFFYAVEWDMVSQRSPAVDVRDTLLLGSDFLRSYDGVYLKEAGFLRNPLITPGLTAGGAGTGSLTDTTYSVIVIYEELDSRGNLVRSQGTPPVSVTVSSGANTGSITVDVPMVRLATSGNNIYCKVYRTDENSGSIYYHAATILNDSTVEETSVTLDADDSVVTDDAQPYTASEVSANPPGALWDLIAGGDKALGVPALDKTKIWESKPIADKVAVEFSDTLVTPVPEGGDIVKLMFMDGRNIIFKRSSIYYRTGEGANAAGQGGYSSPVQLSSSVGALYRDSVALTPLGIVFQSDHGIYLLSRDLQVQPIGDPVADLVDGQEVVRAMSHPTKQEIHFLLDDSDGTVIVWDYGEGAWGQDDTPGASKLVDILALEGVMYYLLADGTVMKEEPGAATWTDDSGDYSCSFKTPWINLDGLNGYQRVRRFGLVGQIDAATSTTNHIQVKVYINYDEDTAVETFNIDYETAGELQIRKRLANQRCSAIMFEILENDQGGSKQGTRYSGISLEVKRKGGTRRLPSGQS